MRTIFVVLSLLAVASGYWYDNPLSASSKKWNDGRIRWSEYFWESNSFVKMPLTLEKAEELDFINRGGCEPNDIFRGYRLMKDEDDTLAYIYNSNKTLAGMQLRLDPSAVEKNYKSAATRPPFLKDGNKYAVTIYFMDPAAICNKGRTAESLAAENVGSNLYIQNSTIPEESILIPRDLTYLVDPQWVEGKCFLTMGRHYWHGVSGDMNCENFGQIFLLYNSGVLTGCGFAFLGDYGSPVFEHPPVKAIPLFMETAPTCLKDYSELSTLHVYMDGSAGWALC